MNTFLHQLRKKHPRSQGDLATLIGVSRQTFSLIEKGATELTISQARKLAHEFNLSLEDYLAERDVPPHEVTLEREKKSSSAQTTLRVSVPQKNVKKFKEVLLYLTEKIGAKPNVGEAVICKLLYFIDFDYYEKYEEQLTGSVYIKNHHGPTPIALPKIVEQMEENKELVRIAEKYFQYQQKKYLPLRKPDLSLLSAREIEHIDWVLARLSDKNAKELEDYSHRDVPWLSAENQQPIDYESVFYRTTEFSVREYDEASL